MECVKEYNSYHLYNYRFVVLIIMLIKMFVVYDGDLLILLRLAKDSYA